LLKEKGRFMRLNQQNRKDISMEIKTLGIDLAKRVFQLHGVDSKGKVVLKKRLGRDALAKFIAKAVSHL
jgi:hypothetical protein